MTTKITLTYCGMEGAGATVKLAKQDAARKIEAVLAGYYTPTMIRAGNLIGVMWREPTGYSYKIIDSDSKPGPMFGTSGGTDRDDENAMRRHMAHHMAQNLNSYAELIKYLSTSDIRDLDTYFAWQAKYKECRAAGMTDTQAYDTASNRP